MKTRKAGTPGAVAAPAGHYVPRHYVKRVARFLVLRAAVRQRQALPLKCPAPVLPRAVLRCPAKVATSASQPLKTESKTANAHEPSQDVPGERFALWGFLG